MNRISHKVSIALACVLLLLGAASCKGKTGPHRQRGAGAPAEADFKIAEIKGLSGADGPDAQHAAESEAPKIVQLLNSYYSAAFLNKAQWAGGAHTKLSALFTPEAKAQLAANLGGLALADLAPKFERITASEQKATKLTFFVEDDHSVPAGVVTTSFRAKGSPVAKGIGSVAIIHDATFWLTKEGDSYKIYAYSADLKADSSDKAVAFGIPRAGVAQ